MFFFYPLGYGQANIFGTTEEEEEEEEETLNKSVFSMTDIDFNENINTNTEVHKYRESYHGTKYRDMSPLVYTHSISSEVFTRFHAKRLDNIIQVQFIMREKGLGNNF